MTGQSSQGCMELDQGMVGAQRMCLAQLGGQGGLQEVSLGLRGGLDIREQFSTSLPPFP